MNVDVAYWAEETDELTYISKADNANRLGELIIQKIPDIQKALSSGILYFYVNDKIIVPYKGKYEGLFNFMSNLYSFPEQVSQ